MATPMVQAKYASSSGNWYIGFDYTVTASTFDMTQLYGYRSNYASTGNLGLKITVSSGTANTTQTDTVTASFGKAAWSNTYWSFGSDSGVNCGGYNTVTGITANSITVTIAVTSTFNSYLPAGTTFTYTIAMPVSKPTLNAVSVSTTSRTSVTCSCSVSSNGGRTVTSSGINIFKESSCSTYVNGISSLSGTISGLSPNTTYYARAWAINSVGTGYSAVKSFTTSGNAPSISWDGMLAIGRKYAIGHWTVVYDTNAWFGAISSNVYGTTTSYDSTATWGWDGSHNAIYYGGDSEETGTLQPNTTYYYKFQQTDNWGRASNILTGSFKTTANPPVITYTVTNITATTAQVNFNTTFDTNTEFQVGWITYGLKTVDLTEGTGSITLTNLTPDQDHKYELGMYDTAGNTTVVYVEFTTPKANATGFVKGYVDGEGVVWQRGTVYIKVNGNWIKGKRIRKKTGGVWSESD